MKRFLPAVFAVLGFASNANAYTIDFNGVIGIIADPYVEDITSIQNPTGIISDGSSTWITPNGTNGLLGSSTSQRVWRADFSVFVDFVSIDLGDFGGSDSDQIYLEAYSQSDSLLDGDSDTLAANSASMKTLSIDASNIAYVLFGISDDSTGIYADNLSYEVQAVPLPAALPLFATALAVTAFLSRRRKRLDCRVPC